MGLEVGTQRGEDEVGVKARIAIGVERACGHRRKSEGHAPPQGALHPRLECDAMAVS